MLKAPFHLIDLISQVHAVEEFLANQLEVDILQWLQTKGELKKLKSLSSEFSTIYQFSSNFELCSNINFNCVFLIKNRQFVFIGEHSTFRPNKIL